MYRDLLINYFNRLEKNYVKMLHMLLFLQTFNRRTEKKMYCLNGQS